MLLPKKMKWVTLIAIFSSSLSWSDEMSLSQEYRLKAAYVYNFTKFIDWPENTFSERNNSLNLCVYDHKQFGNFLKAVVNVRRINQSKRPIVVKNISSLNEIDHCHILYQATFTDLPASKIPEGGNCLIIGDSVGSKANAFAFYKEDRKVRFEVYTDRIQKLGVSISSELLKLARIKKHLE